MKSSNVALTTALLPKLIDCGLSKYVPQEGPAGAMTVFTRTGQRFGTSLYMCPDYATGEGDYDAKSEIYSFGIVLAELLSGKVQGADQVKFDRDSVQDGDIAPDERAGVWPVECVKSLLALVDGCLKKSSKRVPSMVAVMRQLKELEQLHCAPTAEELTNGAAMTAFAEELAQLRLENTARQGKVMSCLSCYDDYPSSAGVECTAAAAKHFLCDGCFEVSVVSQVSADYRGEFVRHASQCVCQFCLPASVSAFSDRQLANHTSDVLFAQYRKATEEVVQVRVTRQVTSELLRKHKENIAVMRQEIANASAQERIIFEHRLTIVEEILTLTCQHRGCGAAIFEFDACFAVRCNLCGNDFCAWCLLDCGRDAHEHVKRCPESKHPGSVYGTKEQFEDHQNGRRKLKVQQYLAQTVAAKDRAAVKTAIEVDLRDLGIVL